MRAHLADFPVLSPTRLADALATLAERPGAVTPLAGATDLYVLLSGGHLAPTTFLDLASVGELDAPPTWEGDRFTFGARTTYTDVRHAPGVVERLPLLVAAAREVGALQIQNRGTWAGNIANASPAADGVPALLAYDATLTLESVRGRREIALADYFTGYKKSVRAADELITRIAVAAPAAGARHEFRKVGTRRMQAISKVVAAGVLERDGGGVVTRARFVLGSVAPVTLRVGAVEEALLGRVLDAGAADRAEAAARGAIAPIDDIRSTRDYRLRIAGLLARAFARPGR